MQSNINFIILPKDRAQKPPAENLIVAHYGVGAQMQNKMAAMLATRALAQNDLSTPPDESASNKQAAPGEDPSAPTPREQLKVVHAHAQGDKQGEKRRHDYEQEARMKVGAGGGAETPGAWALARPLSANEEKAKKEAVSAISIILFFYKICCTSFYFISSNFLYSPTSSSYNFHKR